MIDFEDNNIIHGQDGSDEFREVETVNERYKKKENADRSEEELILDEVEELEEIVDEKDGNEDSEANVETEDALAEAEQGRVEDSDDDERESVCFICHRTEHVTGRQFHLPNNISICDDCMHRTMDTIGQFDYPGMQNPGMFHLFGDPADSDGETPKKFPHISFVNMSDLRSESVSKKQKLKKKRKEAPVIDIKNIPAPHRIKEKLDAYVVGQDYAKKVISVAVYNHYKRVATKTMDEIEIEKSNMLMIGPTGCGKTYLVKTLAKLLDVPLAIADATSLTEAGYIGDDIESVISKLLAAAENDVQRAEMGIVFIDEIDKIAKKKETNSRDVSGESVQQGMLKLLEGADIEVPVGASSKNAMVPLTTVNTRNILFICGGAFPDLDEIIKQRLTKTTSIGYGADLKDRYDKEKNLAKQVTIEDLRKFGMIPEFLGRLPIIYALDALDKEMYVKILKEPKNAILKQYQKLLALDEVELEFDDSALEAIAEKAMERDTGARALRAIIEEFMLDIMYEIPKDDNIGKVTITGDYINGKGGPRIEIRAGETRKLLQTESSTADETETDSDHEDGDAEE